MNPLEVLNEVLAKIANAVSDPLIDLDPDLRRRLSEHSGTVLELECSAPPAVWQLKIEADQLRLEAGSVEEPTVRVRGSAVDLLALFGGRTNSALTIEGDISVLLSIFELLKGYRPEFSDPLAEIVPDGPRMQIRSGLELGIRTVQSALEAVGAEVRSRTGDHVVQNRHMDGLLEGIDELRLRVDRLAARVAVSEAQRGQDGGGR